MKKILVLMMILVLLATLAASTATAEDWTEYTCGEESFSLRVPVAANVRYEEGSGLVIYTGTAGKIPYAVFTRRPLELKFKNTEGYLNNVYREYLKEKYGDSFLGMNPAKMWEAGGKELRGARYMYKVGEYTVVQLKLLDIRDAGDVEYTVKYVEGEDASVMAAVNEAVRTYREAESSAGTGGTDQPQFKKSVLVPADVSGTEINKQSGVYWARIQNADRISDGGYFTADLYVADTYSLQDISNLQEGDQVQMIGQIWTVDAVLPEEDGKREIRVKEEFDGYFVFQKASETTCTLLVNDWVPSRFISREKVMLPLPNAFSYVKMENTGDTTVYDADSFIDLLIRDGTGGWTRYNTLLGFGDGLVSYIIHSDYPDVPNDMESGWAGE